MNFDWIWQEIALDDEEAKQVEAKENTGKIEVLQQYLDKIENNEEFSKGKFCLFNQLW